MKSASVLKSADLSDSPEPPSLRQQCLSHLACSPVESTRWIQQARFAAVEIDLSKAYCTTSRSTAVDRSSINMVI